jgi:hypothetical protein
MHVSNNTPHKSLSHIALHVIIIRLLHIIFCKLTLLQQKGKEMSKSEDGQREEEWKGLNF